ncbi:alpha/beta hydrolase [Streptomyces oryzae]|uniref:Alpha/beta hydrolase n=1 Tax=Streptomyces oryzae TaxID=1434886 RepID=A0ABS3XAN0_9ACTN|nr:alpha/beta hydrolase [Streptomyces oryzae]MBO8192450.1 alpha/beta hydrolase [Streptomyces oryzae]
MRLDHHELVIDVGHGVRIAARDHSSDGAPIVLLHGAGENLAIWDHVTELLAPRYRVIALDFIGHGASSPGKEFTIEADLAAFEHVVREMKLSRAAVLGHSYGGMLAVRYAVDHPECPIVINVDGHGNGRAEHYAGRSPGDVRKFWSRQDAAMVAALAGPDVGSEGFREAHLARMRAFAEMQDVTPEAVSGMGERSLRPFGTSGRWIRNPGGAFMVGMVRQLADWDVFGLYSQAACPVALILAMNPPKIGADADFIRAHRTGLSDAFAELAAGNPQLRLVRSIAGHLLPLQYPRRLATLVEHLYPAR